MDSGSNEEDFGNEKGDCSTEDEDDCYDGNLVDIDKDLDDSRDLQVEMHTKWLFFSRQGCKKSNLQGNIWFNILFNSLSISFS